MAITEIAPEAGRHIVEYIERSAALVLDALAERPRPRAGWFIHSHGAAIEVESPHDGIFERWVLVVPKAPNQAPEEFRTWIDGRLDRLNRYLEATNAGRVVRRLPLDRAMAATIVKRVGHEPGDPRGRLPPDERIPSLLAQFAKDVDAYMRVMGDSGLRYVGALRLYYVPRGGDAPDWRLGLEVVDTVIGRKAETPSLTPVLLVRGVLVEFADLVELRAQDEPAGRPSKRPTPAEREVSESAHVLASQLRAVALGAAVPATTLLRISKELMALVRTEKPTGTFPVGKVVLIVAFVAVAGAVAALSLGLF